MTVGRIARVAAVAGIVAGCGLLGPLAAQAQPNGCPQCAPSGSGDGDSGAPLSIPGRSGESVQPQYRGQQYQSSQDQGPQAPTSQGSVSQGSVSQGPSSHPSANSSRQSPSAEPSTRDAAAGIGLLDLPSLLGTGSASILGTGSAAAGSAAATRYPPHRGARCAARGCARAPPPPAERSRAGATMSTDM
uniref:hypothetical protein n=2 Tax=Nocardia wallacei TaxID=480035 RepID=UPI00245535A8